MIIEDPKEQFESKANIRNAIDANYSPHASPRGDKNKILDSLERDQSINKHNDSLAESNLLHTNRNLESGYKDPKVSPRTDNQNSKTFQDFNIKMNSVEES